MKVTISPNLNPSGSFSIDAWIFPISDILGQIVAKWGDFGDWVDKRTYSFHTLPGLKLRFAIADITHQNDNEFHNFDTPQDVLKLNIWNHVAAVYDQSSGTRKIYVNGIQVAIRRDSP